MCKEDIEDVVFVMRDLHGKSLLMCLSVWDEGLKFAGDVIDMVVEFEVILKLKAEEFGGGLVFESGVVDLKFDVGEGSWVECSVSCLGGVGDKVVVVEVCDEFEVVLGVFLEGRGRVRRG